MVAPRIDGETRLVAAYTGTALPPTRGGQWLRERLPVHMIPRSFHHLEELPRNANGKADRVQLAALVAGQPIRVRTDRLEAAPGQDEVHGELRGEAEQGAPGISTSGSGAAERR